MKKISDYIVTFILLILSVISFFLPRKLRGNFGKFLGLLIFSLSKSRRKITLENLQFAFPEKDEVELKRIRLKSFFNLGITFSEMFAMRFLSEKQINKYLNFLDVGGIQAMYRREKGIVMLSAHFGNWEFLAFGVGSILKIPVTIIVKPQSNQIADKYLNKNRTKGGNRIVSMYHSAFEIIKALKRKEAVALLADQSATKDKDLFIEFFGRPAATYEAPAQLALKMNAPILMAFAIRQPDFTYRIESMELDFSDLTNDENGIKILTERHTNILEDFIRKYPDHWVWQHRRWKHQSK